MLDRHARNETVSWRIRMVRLVFLGLALAVIARLFTLQVLSATFYKTLATGQYSLYEELVPVRGRIYVKDQDDPTEYPVATTGPKAFVFANPSKITDPVGAGKELAQVLGLEGLEEYEQLSVIQQLRDAGRITEAMELESLLVSPPTLPPEPVVAGETVEGELPVPTPEPAPEADPVPPPDLSLDDNPVAQLIARLSKSDDPYEPVARNVNDEQLKLIEALDIEGLDYVTEESRVYPEPGFGGQVLGFLGHKDDGQPVGLYGLEGYYNDFLSGQAGQLYSQTDASGRWIGVGDRKFKPAIDGGEILLTIDRTLQVEVCKRIAEGVAQFKADSGSVIVMQPQTGKILAMCGAPDFYPGDYSNVEDVGVYNNQGIFSAYEPGSVFKPIVMAAGLDTGAVTPNSRFTDTGSAEFEEFTIRNASEKVFGNVSMIEVLEESINTGMVWVMRQLGRTEMREYIHNFGFGTATGIELNSEVSGTIDSLNEASEVYSATASFGQGITVTPLQLVTAYGAIANGGKLMKPYIVDELRYPDGTVEKTEPHTVREVITPTTATTLGAMLVSVVEYGHGKKAAVPGYYIGGKTGTAQISKHGVYSDTDFNGSFAGFGPVQDPVFAMIVKVENPKEGVIFAESTAAPIFGEIAKFILEYYGVAPERPIE